MQHDKSVIVKAAEVGLQEIDSAALAKINQFTLREIEADEVFVFKIAMCDNAIDRTDEVFPLKTLHELSALFVGKTVLFDHLRTAKGQCARIYHTEVVSAEGLTGTSETYSRLVAHCYMLKTDSTKDLITEIEGGIKKEVSVSCRIGAAICSTCGTDNTKKWCEHMPGHEYNGSKCYFSLENAKDAYEVSFVAVPAQPKAGTLKAYGAEPPVGTNEKEVPGIDNKSSDLQIDLDLASAFLITQE